MDGPIHHVIGFDVAPEMIYDELVRADNFAAWTDAPAEIDPTPGGAFSLFGGQIDGRNIELVPGVRVVQAWRVAGWEAGQYSLTRFELRPEPPGTTLTFDHIGFPPEARQELDGGWHAMYWEPMRRHLAPG